MSRLLQRFRAALPQARPWGSIALLVLAALSLLIPGLPASLIVAAGVVGLLLLSARADEESRRSREIPGD